MTTRMQHDVADEPGGGGFWIGALIGFGIMGFGLRGLLDAAPATRPTQVLVGSLGLDLLHDALIAPVACAAGVMLARFLPRRLIAPVRAGLFASAAVIIVGWAALRGYGRANVSDNSTVDPLNYGNAVLVVLAIVWCGVSLWAAFAWFRSRPMSEAASP